MKKALLVMTALLSTSIFAHAQWTTTGNNIYNSNTGNVGIGTATPTNLLTLNSTGGASLLLQKGGSAIAALSVDGTSSTWNGGGSIGLNLIATNADISMQTGAPALPTLVIKNNGNVGIGITAPQNKLDVNGTIHSKQVKIDLNGWSDYVFKKSYQLRSLNDVKVYIDQHQHLPEIPSEAEMVKTGLDVSEANKLLLKKVEELTLYIIAQDKSIKILNNRMKRMESAYHKKVKKT